MQGFIYSSHFPVWFLLWEVVFNGMKGNMMQGKGVFHHQLGDDVVPRFIGEGDRFLSIAALRGEGQRVAGLDGCAVRPGNCIRIKCQGILPRLVGGCGDRCIIVDAQRLRRDLCPVDVRRARGRGVEGDGGLRRGIAPQPDLIVVVHTGKEAHLIRRDGQGAQFLGGGKGRPGLVVAEPRRPDGGVLGAGLDPGKGEGLICLDNYLHPIIQ